jgi:hypothetical protein
LAAAGRAWDTARHYKEQFNMNALKILVVAVIASFGISADAAQLILGTGATSISQAGSGGTFINGAGSIGPGLAIAGNSSTQVQQTNGLGFGTTSIGPGGATSTSGTAANNAALGTSQSASLSLGQAGGLAGQTGTNLSQSQATGFGGFGFVTP